VVTGSLAATALRRLATLLDLHGEPRDVVQGCLDAARLAAARSDSELPDLATRESVVAPARTVLAELLEHGSAPTLDGLEERTPEGLLEMLRIPGLGPAKVRAIHAGLDIESMQELEAAARDGRLAALPRFGERTAERVRQGLATLRENGAPVLLDHGRAEAARLVAALNTLTGVRSVHVAGALRRSMETVTTIDLVVETDELPELLGAMLSSLRGATVLEGSGSARSPFRVRFAGGLPVTVRVARPSQVAVAMLLATGSDAHVQAVRQALATAGLQIVGFGLHDREGQLVALADEGAVYRAAGLSFVPPELREDASDVALAAAGRLPQLVELHDVTGVLHCHSHYSDGGPQIVDIAAAARERGWQYLGISDHSQSAYSAGGLTRDAIARQHEEIDLLNAQYAASGLSFRVLKGIEADILPCGRVDYDAITLDRFDYVIGSIHTRFGMNEVQMTERVLKALDDKHLTMLGHPTGRLLLTREPFPIDMHAVIAKAGEVGVAVELNADPHRLDIDWRWCRVAKALGARVAIGPDAHTISGLDNVALGVAMARKGGLEARDVFNAMPMGEVLSVARARSPSTVAA
jgi:DNA polymerase (family X)